MIVLDFEDLGYKYIEDDAKDYDLAQGFGGEYFDMFKKAEASKRDEMQRNKRNYTFDSQVYSDLLNNDKYQEAVDYLKHFQFTDTNKQRRWTQLIHETEDKRDRHEAMLINFGQDMLDANKFIEMYGEDGGLERLENNPYGKQFAAFKQSLGRITVARQKNTVPVNIPGLNLRTDGIVPIQDQARPMSPQLAKTLNQHPDLAYTDYTPEGIVLSFADVDVSGNRQPLIEFYKSLGLSESDLRRAGLEVTSKRGVVETSTFANATRNVVPINPSNYVIEAGGWSSAFKGVKDIAKWTKSIKGAKNANNFYKPTAKDLYTPGVTADGQQFGMYTLGHGLGNAVLPHYDDYGDPYQTDITSIRIPKTHPLFNRIITSLNVNDGEPIDFKISGYGERGETPIYLEGVENLLNVYRDAKSKYDQFENQNAAVPKEYSTMIGDLVDDGLNEIREKYARGLITTAQYEKAVNGTPNRVLEFLKGQNISDYEVYTNYSNNLNKRMDAISDNREKEIFYTTLMSMPNSRLHIYGGTSQGKYGVYIKVDGVVKPNKEKDKNSSNSKSETNYNPETMQAVKDLASIFPDASQNVDFYNILLDNPYDREFSVFIPGIMTKEVQAQFNRDTKLQAAKTINDIQDWNRTFTTHDGNKIMYLGSGQFAIGVEHGYDYNGNIVSTPKIVDSYTAQKEINKSLIIQDISDNLKYRHMNKAGDIIDKDAYLYDIKRYAIKASNELSPSVYLDTKAVEDIFSKMSAGGGILPEEIENMTEAMYDKYKEIFEIYNAMIKNSYYYIYAR